MKKILYFIVVSVVSVFTNLHAHIVYGQTNMGNTFYGTAIDRLTTTLSNSHGVVIFLAFLAIPLLGTFSFLKRGTVKITFMDDGKKVVKYGKIISSNKKEVVFKSKNNTYTCPRSAIMKIQKRNRPLITLIFYFIVIFLAVIAGNIYGYLLTEWDYYNSRREQQGASLYGGVLSDKDWEEYK